VQGVSQRFGGLQALDDVSVDVPDGAIVGLIGPNGAGKTTLFNIISGLHAPTAGAVRFDDRDITGLAAHARAQLGIGRSFQNLGLMVDETAETNVLAALHRSAGYSNADVVLRPWRFLSGERRLAQRCTAALSAFGLEAEAQTDVADLPFGKARFVEIAAVMAEEPRLMLLDEPTTGLDVEEIRRFEVMLQAIRERGTTILVVAHDVGFVMRMCDYVYVLAEGKVLSAGAPAEIRDDPRVVEAYLGRSA
jgi:branched-chain amino acid transport system ATP-binding protein